MSSKLGVAWSVKFIALLWHVTSFYIQIANGGSIKDGILAEIVPLRTKMLTRIDGQISSLDTSVERLSDRMSKLEGQTTTLKKAVNDEQRALEKVTADFSSIEDLLFSHGKILEEVKSAVYPDEKTFVFSNETCGGVLHAQSGYVIYTSKGQQQGRSSLSLLSYISIARANSSSWTWTAATCVWTLQANHRSTVKLTSHIMEWPFGYSSSGHYSGAYVLEGLADAPSATSTNVTRLLRGVTYTFKGPLLYVILYFPENTQISTLNPFSFQFQYESKGKRTKGNTFFSHRNLNVTHSMDQTTLTENDLDVPVTEGDMAASRQLTSIVLSNFTTKLRLRASWERGKCVNTSVMIFPLKDLFLENSSQNSSNPVGAAFTNLCERGSQKPETKLFTSYGAPLLVLINKPREPVFPFNLSWTLEPAYGSSYVATDLQSFPVCGEVLSGASGIILLNKDSYYRNGKRCVWAIVPQNAYTLIQLEYIQSATHNKKENQNYDHVYAVEFTTVDGLERPQGPKITKLNNESNSSITYNATSREVFVVFYSDYSGTNPGFRINWKILGDPVSTGSDISTRFTYFSENSGVMTLDTDKSPFFQTLNQIFMFVPNLPYNFRTTPNYVFGMDLYFDQANVSSATLTNTSLGAGGNSSTTCFQENFYVLASAEGNIRQAHIECIGTGKAVIKNADGFVMVILRNISASAIGNQHKLALNFSWKQAYAEGDNSVFKMENDRCGGVIIGDRGILRYKLSQKYNRNEHCIWLLQSTSSSSFSFKVLKNGFEEDDRLAVNSIDVDSGTLRDDAVQLGNSSSIISTFNDSLLVISFRPSATSANNTGFILQFWSSNSEDSNLAADTASQNNTDTEYIDFRLRHSERHSGRFYYDGTNQSSPTTGKQLHVIAFSYNTLVNTGYRPAPTNVSWSSGLFKKDTRDCTYDSLTFYCTIRPEDSDKWNPDTGNSSNVLPPPLWEQNAQFPDQNQTSSCPGQISVTNRHHLFTANYTAFLVIYKLVGSPVEESSRDDRQIDFTHTKVVARRYTSYGTSVPVETESDEYLDSNNPIWSAYTPAQRQLLMHLMRRHRIQTSQDTGRHYGRVIPYFGG